MVKVPRTIHASFIILQVKLGVVASKNTFSGHVKTRMTDCGFRCNWHR